MKYDDIYDILRNLWTLMKSMKGYEIYDILWYSWTIMKCLKYYQNFQKHMKSMRYYEIYEMFWNLWNIIKSMKYYETNEILHTYIHKPGAATGHMSMWEHRKFPANCKGKTPLAAFCFANKQYYGKQTSRIFVKIGKYSDLINLIDGLLVTAQLWI